MKEARLIVPKECGEEVIALVRRRLIRLFGGYTEIEGRGGWQGNGGSVEEAIHVFDVAMDEEKGIYRASLHALASIVAELGKQEAVYVRYADGVVEFVKGDGEHVAA